MKKTSELIGAELDLYVARAGKEWQQAHNLYPTMTLDPTFSGVRIGRWPRGEYGALIETCILEPTNPFRQDHKPFCPSEHWEHGGPIIEREMICIDAGDGSYKGNRAWSAHLAKNAPAMSSHEEVTGPTPLIAAMRAYVASVFGEEVE